jgi:hypothetical protein
MIRDLMKQFGRKHRVYLKIKKVENNIKKKGRNMDNINVLS